MDEAGITEWIARLYEDPEMLLMGHNQRADDLNLGLGWLYYALGRLVHPARAVVIGSYRGFVPLVIAKALSDNCEDGGVTFIDPSMVDGFWTDAATVAQHFASFGLDNIEHHLATTQDFVESDAFRALDEIGLLFVDGYHSAEQARYDHEAFKGRLAPRSITLFHDSMNARCSTIYGDENPYTMSVGQYIDELRRDPRLQVFDLPFGNGLTLVREPREDETALTEGQQARIAPGPPHR